MAIKYNNCYKSGDIVKIAGINFVVLDSHIEDGSDEEETLLVLAVETVGSSRFGDTNNYAESDLKKAVDNWLYELTETLTEQYGADTGLIKSRVIDLLTMDGHGKYGKLEVAAAPLTLDEARKYADLIPECDEWNWLSTGWGGPEMFGSTYALFVYASGNCYNSRCSNSYGIRPALVVSSSLFDSEPQFTEDELGMLRCLRAAGVVEITRNDCGGLSVYNEWKESETCAGTAGTGKSRSCWWIPDGILPAIKPGRIIILADILGEKV